MRLWVGSMSAEGAGWGKLAELCEIPGAVEVREGAIDGWMGAGTAGKSARSGRFSSSSRWKGTRSGQPYRLSELTSTSLKDRGRFYLRPPSALLGQSDRA